MALTHASAAAQTTTATSQDSDPQSGTLVLKNPFGQPTTPALRLGTDMTVTVSGNIARVQVTQVFRNVSQEWAEGVYLYPLPENAAVDSLKMTVGNRVIIGKIKKREEAREIYETAKQEGKKAGLVEQQRPNMFTNSVANIGPGETVMVAIEYQMQLKQLNGKYSIRLPLVVGARYVPPRTLTNAASLDDAKTITAAPLVYPEQGKVNPVSITINLAPGFAPANIYSPYHKIVVSGEDEQRTIRLADGIVPQDRDFELSWISASASPTLALYREERDGVHYVMASVTPPVPDENSFVPPREMIFVIDNSGSMSGTSMIEAKASLQNALGTLRQEDHFNIIRFDDTMEMVFDESVAATQKNIQIARKFTQKLEAQGGTEMLPALLAALVDQGTTNRQDVIRQVIFLTDGNISNELEMLEAIGIDGGNSRIFTVGIGSAPNNYLMRKMASTGRGIYTNIGKAGEVTAKMAELLDMLSRPTMQNVKITATGADLDLTPKLLPDLYAGEPLVVLGRGASLEGTLTISGMFEQNQWSRSIDLSQALQSSAIAKLWARQSIEDVEADRVLGNINYIDADAAIAQIGLDFHIVTSQTSLVAVDQTPSRPGDMALRREDLPINLPEGWDFDTLFGGETARAALANERKLKQQQSPTVPEPELEAEQEVDFDVGQMMLVTGTNYLAQLMAGLMAMLLGLFGFLYLRREQEV